MESVKVELNVPKESKEVIDALAAVYDFVKAGKSLSEIAELFDELTLAVMGADKLKEEVKSEDRNAIMSYLVHVLADKVAPVETVEA